MLLARRIAWSFGRLLGFAFIAAATIIGGVIVFYALSALFGALF